MNGYALLSTVGHACALRAKPAVSKWRQRRSRYVGAVTLVISWRGENSCNKYDGSGNGLVLIVVRDELMQACALDRLCRTHTERINRLGTHPHCTIEMKECIAG
jgi:hypothetical protein